MLKLATSFRAVLALGVLALLMLGARYLAEGAVVTPGDEAAFGLGCVLIAAYVGGELAAAIKLPKLTGYLLMGVALGPEIPKYLGWEPRFLMDESVGTLRLLDDVAIGIIAFLGGGELRWGELRKGLKGFCAMLTGHLVVGGVAAGAVVVLMPGLLGLGSLSSPQVWAAAILVGVVAGTASPATALAIRTEARAKGPVADSVLAVTVLIDIAIAVLLTVAVAAARGVIGGGGDGGHGIGYVAWEVLGSLGAGVIVGGLLVVLISRVKNELPAVLLACAVGAMYLASMLHLSGLLVCMVAGFVVENGSRHGHALVHTLERSSLPLFAVFFAVSGARIEVGGLLSAGVGLLVLCGVRGVGAWAGTWLGARLSGAPPIVGRWLWTGMLGQAGLSLALAATMVRSFPELAGLGTVILGSVAINQTVGPVLFGVALKRADEVGKADEEAVDDPDAAPGTVPAPAH